jgi:predicted transcriptional regulator
MKVVKIAIFLMVGSSFSVHGENTKDQAMIEYKKQRSTYWSQVDETNRQLEEANRQQKLTKEMLKQQQQQLEKQAALLNRWEKVIERHEKLLDIWEKRENPTHNQAN